MPMRSYEHLSLFQSGAVRDSFGNQPLDDLWPALGSVIDPKVLDSDARNVVGEVIGSDERIREAIHSSVVSGTRANDPVVRWFGSLVLGRSADFDASAAQALANQREILWSHLNLAFEILCSQAPDLLRVRSWISSDEAQALRKVARTSPLRRMLAKTSDLVVFSGFGRDVVKTQDLRRKYSAVIPEVVARVSRILGPEAATSDECLRGELTFNVATAYFSEQLRRSG